MPYRTVAGNEPTGTARPAGRNVFHALLLPLTGYTTLLAGT